MGDSDAFKAFEFGADERWLQYFSGVEVPHGDKAAITERLKLKWYKKNVDPEYQAPVSQAAAAKPEPQAFGGNGASEPSSAAADAEPSPSAPPPPGPRPASDRPSPAPAPPVQRPGWAPSLAGASAWAQNLGGRAAAAARGAARGGMQGAGRNPAALLFALHVLQLVLALGVVLPVRSWGVRPWQLFQLAAFAAHGAKTVLKHGWPQLSLAALQQYAMSAMPTTDCQCMLMSLMLLASAPMALAILPTTTLALYHAMAYAAGKLGHTAVWRRVGARAHAWLLARQAKALEVNAFAEIGTGFLLLAMLLTARRSLILTFYYWKNFLPLRYWSPDSAACHRQAWAVVEQYAAPVLQNSPFLSMPVRLVRRWFTPPQ